MVARGGMVGALYILLTLLSSVMGLSSGVIQCRLSEMLCVAPIFMPEAIFGLSIGCALANLFTGAPIWDILFGSIATLIGAVGAYLLKNLPKKFKWLATLPTIASNTLIIPPILTIVYQAEESIFILALFIFIGELISAGIFGSMLYYSLDKTRVFKE